VTNATARVRVTSSADATVVDSSDADFSITQNPSSQVHAIHMGDSWRYWDTGTDPGASWTQASFNDSTWKSGVGQLGYGGHGEATLVQRTSPSQSSVLFRKQITVNGAVTAAQLTALFDDGVAVWVNGTLVYSKNCDRGLGFSTFASTSVNNEVETAMLTPSAFVNGVNEIAVMVKQIGKTSPDLEFDLSMDLTVAAP
jgi:hypothetical protein